MHGQLIFAVCLADCHESCADFKKFIRTPKGLRAAAADFILGFHRSSVNLCVL
jgi:hypothetical protein